MTNSISRLFGKFANKAFTPWFQRIINNVYVKIFDIDLSEFQPAHTYATLNALFTRQLQISRKIDSNDKVIISPADSKILAQGEIKNNKAENDKAKNNLALQIKGMSYSVDELLGENIESNYSYINFYLSPRDYHRYHAPCDMEILESRHFGGVLLPVNKPSLRKNENLFVKNERVVIIARDQNGEKLYFIAVGALNVGQMVFHFDPRIRTNAKPNTNQTFTYDTPIKVKKGDELGMFMMGSTIVLFAKNITLSQSLESSVKFGQEVALFD